MLKMAIIVVVIMLVFLAGIAFVKFNQDQANSQKNLVKCPIMGTMIDPAKAYSKTVYKGKTYYFCCDSCPGEFNKNPEKYAK